jgi:tyrosyl-tRNA synthetase
MRSTLKPNKRKNLQTMNNKDFIEELQWRGMIHTIMPGTEEQLKKEMTTAYLGIDPTADSLHIGHLVGVMILKHFQMCGHRPIALVGGATGMIGDPSGKSQERNLLDEPTLRRNQEAIKRQLGKLLDFESDAENRALLVNNYDWMKEFSFLDFAREIGKVITVNYMMAKDSVKKRFNGDGDGMSFTEFTYQLLQGYDFLHLYQEYGCKVQLGGADQWGNITTGTELIRRKLGGENEAFAITCPLITKADGTKFGKTESGNIWLDARYTSPYKFYQFWLNVSDEDAKRYIKIFTLLDRETIDALIAEHDAAPHLRALQKRLAEELTCMIHSKEEWQRAVEASSILFGGATSDALRRLDEQTLLQVFEGVPQYNVPKSALGAFIDLVVEHAPIFPSKGECRKMIQGGGVSLDKEKVADPMQQVSEADLIAGKYLLVQRGKKNYYLITVE